MKYLLTASILLAGCVFAAPGYSYSESSKATLDEAVRAIKIPTEEGGLGLVQDKKLRFNFAASEIYDNNIFLTKDNTQYDLITVLAPGAVAYYGNSKSLYYITYKADVLVHTVHTNQTRVNQDIEGRIELFRNSPIKLTAMDIFQPTTDPATSETNDFIKRVYNDFKTILKYNMSDKSTWEIAYDQVLQNYVSSDYKKYSYLQQIVSPTVYWHITPKSSVTGEYNIGMTRYYEGTDDDSVYHQARAGITGQLTSRSRIFLKAGYQYRIYKAAARKNTQGAVVECGYNYKLSEKTSLEIILGDNINESVYESVGYYKSLNAYASLRHSLTNSMRLNISGVYIRNDYPSDTMGTNGEVKRRNDNLYGADARLEYQFRYWCSMFLGYEFRIRNSNMRDFEYENTRISCGTKVDF